MNCKQHQNTSTYVQVQQCMADEWIVDSYEWNDKLLYWGIFKSNRSNKIVIYPNYTAILQ